MLVKKIKKLIGVTTLAIMIGLGFVNGGQAVGAQSISIVSEDSTEIFEEQFGYGPYEPYSGTVAELTNLIKEGILSEEEGNLQIKFLEAVTEDEKEAVYKDIVDCLYRENILTVEEADKLKLGSYKDYWRILDEIFYNELVYLGYITEEEANLELRFNAAENSQERQAVYEEIVDFRLKEGEITEEQAKKLKLDGYAKDFDNMDDFCYQDRLIELFDLGLITQDEKDKLSVRTDEERWDDIFVIYDKYFINQEVENGNLSQEEADLYLRYLDATDSEEKQRLYEQIIEKMYEKGEISEEELREIKELI